MIQIYYHDQISLANTMNWLKDKETIILGIWNLGNPIYGIDGKPHLNLGIRTLNLLSQTLPQRKIQPVLGRKYARLHLNHIIITLHYSQNKHHSTFMAHIKEN